MDTTLLLVLLVFLGAMMLVAWLINKISQRKVFNGALIFIPASILLLIYLIAHIPNIKANPEAVGHLITPFVGPWLLALYFARKK